MHGLRLPLVVALLVGIVGCGDQPAQKSPVRGVYVVQASMTGQVGKRSFPGKAKAVEEANLSFDVNGTLNKLPIKVGDEVKKGQLLASLDERDFIARLNSAKAELDKSEKNLARAKKLVKQDFVSQAEYDRMFATVQVNRSNVDVAKKALEDTDITAPFDGVITQKFVENFEAVRAKQVIARILDISDIEMIVEIPENLMSKLRRIKTVEVVFDSYPDKPFTATIKEVGQEASTTTRTFPVTLVMAQAKDFKILPGMSGNASAKAFHDDGNKPRNYLLPVAAVFTPNDQKKNFVWVVDTKTNTVSMRPVEMVTINANGAVIKSGIKADEWIVAAGVHQLRENQKVKLLKQVAR